MPGRGAPLLSGRAGLRNTVSSSVDGSTVDGSTVDGGSTCGPETRTLLFGGSVRRWTILHTVMVEWRVAPQRRVQLVQKMLERVDFGGAEIGG